MTADKQSGAFAWTTIHEQRFILTATGQDRHEVPRTVAGRIAFLRGYIKGALRRTEWGAVNREAVMTFAEEMLKEVA